jgi:signal transduction histidine kinase
MKNRAGKINSSLDITSQPNGGTIVQLTIPAQIKKIP